MRRNSRNECVKLRKLLLSACSKLEMYGIAPGQDLDRWYKAQKTLATVRRNHSLVMLNHYNRGEDDEE